MKAHKTKYRIVGKQGKHLASRYDFREHYDSYIYTSTIKSRNTDAVTLANNIFSFAPELLDYPDDIDLYPL